MKVSRQQASGNRDAIVQAAAAQVRCQGFAQMSVAAAANAAGLTHGALYRHFASKGALQAAAMERASRDCLSKFADLTPDQLVDLYLSALHRDEPEQGCPIAALVSEVRWQPEEIRNAFRDSFERFVSLVEDTLRSGEVDHGRDRGVLVFVAMIGGLAISRAVRNLDEETSDDVLRVVADQLCRVIAGWRGQGGTGAYGQARCTVEKCESDLKAAVRETARLRRQRRV